MAHSHAHIADTHHSHSIDDIQAYTSPQLCKEHEDNQSDAGWATETFGDITRHTFGPDYSAFSLSSK